MAEANTTEGTCADPATQTAAALRDAQAVAYEREDFPACFAAGERLAVADPAYGRSYGHFMHVVLHALARTVTGIASSRSAAWTASGSTRSTRS